MTIAQRRSWLVGTALFLVILLGLLVGLPTTLSAGCRGAAEISPEQITSLRNLLSAATAPGDFHVYAETPSADGLIRFVLYSVPKAPAPGAHIVYLAVTTLEPQPNIVFVHDVSAYLPLLTRVLPSGSDVSTQGAPHSPEPGPLAIDGCLNAFVLKPDLQAVHMNLFAHSPRYQSEGANDIVFALLEHGSLKPVLELNQSSFYDHKRVHRDSVIAVLPSAAVASDLIWWQSSQEDSGMLTAAYDQNTLYSWSEKGFEKAGTLEPADLAARLRVATPLTRSDAISTVEMKQTVPGPNQPPP